MCGVRLFLQHHVHAYQFGFVAQHVDKASMWHLHKVLVVARSNADLLLPFGVLSITIRIIPLQENKHDDRFARKRCWEIHLVNADCRQAISQGRACELCRLLLAMRDSLWQKQTIKIEANNLLRPSLLVSIRLIVNNLYERRLTAKAALLISKMA